MRPGPADPPEVYAITCPGCDADVLPWQTHDNCEMRQDIEEPDDHLIPESAMTP